MPIGNETTEELEIRKKFCLKVAALSHKIAVKLDMTDLDMAAGMMELAAVLIGADENTKGPEGIQMALNCFFRAYGHVTGSDIQVETYSQPKGEVH